MEADCGWESTIALHETRRCLLPEMASFTHSAQTKAQTLPLLQVSMKSIHIMVPQLCPLCQGIMTIHGVVAGGSDCPFCSQKTVSSEQPSGNENVSRPERSKKEPTTETMGLRAQIFDNDVVLGRGKAFLKFPGNVRYRSLLRENCDEYAACVTARSKTAFTIDIVRQIRRDGGRFLKPNGKDSFVEISDAEARVKVSQVCG